MDRIQGKEVEIDRVNEGDGHIWWWLKIFLSLIRYLSNFFNLILYLYFFLVSFCFVCKELVKM
jgi:hypothetical protein